MKHLHQLIKLNTMKKTKSKINKEQKYNVSYFSKDGLILYVKRFYLKKELLNFLRKYKNRIYKGMITSYYKDGKKIEPFVN